MTIQVSVIIWTVISFCVLAFVLNKFLFKPMFRIMDARAEKVSQSAAEKENELNARAVRRQEAELAHAAEVKAAVEQGEQAVDSARNETKQKVLMLKIEHTAELEKVDEDLQKESTEIKDSFTDTADQLANKFADSFSHNTFPFEPVSGTTYQELVAAAEKALEEKHAKISKHTANDNYTTEETEPAEVTYKTEEERRIAERKAEQKAKIEELRVELLQESAEIKEKFSDDADGLALEYVSTVIR